MKAETSARATSTKIEAVIMNASMRIDEPDSSRMCCRQ